MCMSTPKAPPPKPTRAPPPPPEKAPAELESAVDTGAANLRKKKKGPRGVLGRGASGTQVKGMASGSGLNIGKSSY